jgi:hypothetical protein
VKSDKRNAKCDTIHTTQDTMGVGKDCGVNQTPDIAGKYNSRFLSTNIGGVGLEIIISKILEIGEKKGERRMNRKGREGERRPTISMGSMGSAQHQNFQNGNGWCFLLQKDRAWSILLERTTDIPAGWTGTGSYW